MGNLTETAEILMGKLPWGKGYASQLQHIMSTAIHAMNRALAPHGARGACQSKGVFPATSVVFSEDECGRSLRYGNFFGSF
jgi:hypothetical protein